MSYIEVKNVTKDYGKGRGIFNISFNIEKGEMFGFVGTNGAGKTTTIRHLLGFSKPDAGKILVKGMNPWTSSYKFMNDIGYIPGEIAFPDLRSGTDVIKSQAEFLKIKDLSYANSLIKKLQLDVRGNPRSMSKGMKQKLAIVLALMNDPEILFFDEPTTGLDPLMRDCFMQIVAEEHKKGKTILMSSHMFEELEGYSDKVGLIMNGKIIDIVNMNEFRNIDWKLYKIEFQDERDFKDFLNNNYEAYRIQETFNQVTIKLKNGDAKRLFSDLAKYKVKFLREVDYNLEKYFKEELEKTEEKKNDKQTII